MWKVDLKAFNALRAFKEFKALKMKIFNFELKEKLDQYFDLKFDAEAEFDRFGAEKWSREPLSDPL